MDWLETNHEQENLSIEMAWTYEQLYVLTKFNELCEKLVKTHGHNYFPKNWNNQWLSAFARDNYIELDDYTQKWNKQHKMILSYDKTNGTFNLSEILWLEEHTYNNITLRQVQKFLDNIENKMKERMNGKNIDKTSKAISSAIENMFRESDRGLFKRGK